MPNLQTLPDLLCLLYARYSAVPLEEHITAYVRREVSDELNNHVSHGVLVQPAKIIIIDWIA